MPLPLTADTVEVILQGRVDAQVTINTLWFQKVGGAVTPTDVQAIAIAVGNWYEGTLRPLLSEDWSTETVRCVDRSVGAGALFEGTIGPTPGGVASEAAPNNVAAVVSFSGGSVGRFARGRNFVPAIPNASIALNTLDGGFITDLVNAYNALLPGGGVDLSGFVWVVVSHFSGVDPVTHQPIPRGAGLTTAISSVVMKTPFVKSMRTREVGKGK